MLHRSIRVTFRMTSDQRDRYEVMISDLHCMNWTNLVLEALEQMRVRNAGRCDVLQLQKEQRKRESQGTLALGAYGRTFENLEEQAVQEGLEPGVLIKPKDAILIPQRKPYPLGKFGSTKGKRSRSAANPAAEGPCPTVCPTPDRPAGRNIKRTSGKSKSRRALAKK